MRALIRGKDETVIENMGIPGIEWDTGYPLTDPGWFGGPYVLVENFDQTVCEVVGPDEFFERASIETANTETEFTIQERGIGINHANTPAPETVTIDGKTYTKDELLALLNQTN